MTDGRRNAIVLIALVAIAACTTGATPQPPSIAAVVTTPGASPAPTRTPIPWITPFPNNPISVPAPTLGPDWACSALGAAVSPTYNPPNAGAGIDTGLYPVGMSLDISRVETVGDPDLAWSREPMNRKPWGRGLVPGGHEVQGHVRVGYRYPFEWPITLIAAKATLRVDGQRPQTLETRITTHPDVERGRLMVTFPDVAASGRLGLEVQWTDRCLTYFATGREDVTIVPGDIVAACPTKSPGLFEYTEALRQPPLEVGGVPARWWTHSTVPIWGRGGISSQGNWSWDRGMVPAQATPGSTIRVSEANPDLRLESLHATFYRRRDVIESRYQAEQVLRRRPAVDPRGHFDLPVPSTPGRYVAELSFGWESPCVRGQSTVVVSIDVE